MAIRINFVTQFDNRGIKKAQREIQAIGRNIGRGLDMAVGGAFAGAVAGLAASVQSLARIEQINKQTETAITSMGDAAGISAKEVEALAGQLEVLTATEAEAIQQGANLLLTFANIKNSAGEGNDIFNQTVTAMVDISRAMGTDASASAIQLGKALNDPTQGISALTRVGVSFTAQQKDQIKALQASGDIMGAQKIILSELQNQFGGSGAAFATTFQGQVALLGHEIGTVGEEIATSLMPSLSGLIQEVRTLTPEIGDKLKTAFASIDFKPMIDFAIFFISNIDKIMATVTVLWTMSKAVLAIEIAMKLAAVATGLFTGALAVNPIMLAVTAIGLLIAGAVKLKDALDNIGASDIKRASNAAANRAGQAAYDAYIAKAKREQTNTGVGSILPTEIAAAERARKAAYDKAIRDAALARVKGSGMSNTLSEFAAQVKKVDTAASGSGSGSGGGGAAKAVAKVSVEAKKLADSAKKAADALKIQKEALANFKTELIGLTIQPLVDLRREIGKFEQNAIDSFQNIRDTVQQGILDKTIGAKGAANLLAYVNKESAAFEKLARQRDELAAKRSLAESIFKDVKSGIVGLANLNSFLERQTETVTETVTRIVSGVKIATTRTIEELKANGNIVSGFKDVLAKTKAFAAQLKTLRELGLDRNLYAQIVESGVEAGSQTAAAIIEGGAGTVNELNSLFADLNAVGSEIAEQTATIMYEAGETIGSALIDGLKAQEAALVEQAKKMAEVFNQNFTSQVQAIQTPTVEATGKETLSFTLADIKKMTGDLGTGAIAQQNAKLAAQLINRPEYTAYGTVVNISVKADATTNGKALGAAIQAELNKYAKASK